MRIFARVASFIGIAAVVGVISATPASAVPHAVAVGRVTGSAPFVFNDGCDFVHQHYIGRIETPGAGRSSIDVDVCISIGSSEFTGDGTFTLETPKGTLTGSAHGTVALTPGPKTAFAFTLGVGGSTAGVGAGSTLYFRGFWKSNLVDGGPIRGRIGTSPH